MKKNLFCALPALASIAVGLVMQFTPQLNLSDSRFDGNLLLLLTVPVFPWIIGLLLLLIRFCVLRLKAKKAQPADGEHHL